MTLKEKFRLHVKFWDCYNDEPLKYDHENKCVKIADEFAIGFAEWCASEEATSLIEDLIIVGELNKVPETKELLQIFKKEKGL